MALYRNIAGYDEESGQFDSLLKPIASDGMYTIDPAIVLPKVFPPTVYYDPAVADPGLTNPILPPTQTLQPPATTNLTPAGDPPTTPTTELPFTATNTTGEPQVLPLSPTSTKTDWLPLLTLGGLFATIFIGERYIPKKQKVVFVAGLGALYYQFSKK